MSIKPDLRQSFITQFLKTTSFIRTISKFSAIGLVVCSSLSASFVTEQSSYAYNPLKNRDDVAQTKQNSRSRGNYNDFLLALARRETGQPNPTYNVVGKTVDALGKYQFIEGLLVDLKYYETPNPYIGGGNGVPRNYWRGKWKKGINSTQEFLENKNNVQEIAIREAMEYKWRLIQNQLNGRSIKEFIGQKREGVVITESGILAAAHLRGEQGVVQLLLNNKLSNDENGTSILAYLREFAGYEVPFN